VKTSQGKKKGLRKQANIDKRALEIYEQQRRASR